MIIIELPIVYADNYKDIEKGEQSGVEIEAIESIESTAFFLPNDSMIRLNKTDRRSNLEIFGQSYLVDLTYEYTLMAIKDAIRKSNAKQKEE